MASQVYLVQGVLLASKDFLVPLEPQDLENQDPLDCRVQADQRVIKDFLATLAYPERMVSLVVQGSQDQVV